MSARSRGRALAAVALAAGSLACGGDAGSGRARNVLLVSIDTCRADRLGCYGYEGGTTPHLDALAAQGVLFEEVGATNPVTLPAHTSMLTGTVPPFHGVSDNNQRVDAASTTLAESLAAHGLRTAAFVSAFVLDSRFGLDQGFEVYDDDFGASGEDSLWSLDQRRGGDTTDAALDWLDGHHDEPFFLFVHYYDPHTPYAPPAPFDARFADAPYDGEIAYVDASVGRLLARLEELGAADDTLVVVTADHGESLDEHGERTHMYFAYQSTLRVPLIVRAPGGRQAARVDTPVGAIDLAPTVLAVLGARGSADLEGEDLSPYLFGEDAVERERLLYGESLVPTKYGAAALRSLRSGNWKYIRSVEPELYDLDRDPGELENLFEDRGDMARALEQRLASLLADHREQRAARVTAELDDESLERIRNLGYVGGAISDSFDLPEDARDAKDLLDLHLRFLATYHMLAEERLDEAYAHGSSLVEEFPWLLEAHGLLGGIAVEQERWADARRHYEEYLARAEEELRANTDASPFRLDAGLCTVHVELARVHLEAGRPARAVEQLEAALAIQGDHVDALIELARLLSEGRGDFERAVELYRRALAVEPGDVYAQGSLGNCLFALERHEEATEAYRAALELDPGDADLQFNLGSVLSARERWREALEPLRAARELTPENSAVHTALARALERVGELDEAIVSYREALRRGSGSADVVVELAVLLHDQGRPERARAVFEAGARTGPRGVRALRRKAVDLAAHPDEAERRPAEALLLARVLDEVTGGEDPQVLDALAVALAAGGDFEAAVASCERALQLVDPGDLALRARLETRLYSYRRSEPFVRTSRP